MRIIITCTNATTEYISQNLLLKQLTIASRKSCSIESTLDFERLPTNDNSNKHDNHALVEYAHSRDNTLLWNEHSNVTCMFVQIVYALKHHYCDCSI